MKLFRSKPTLSQRVRMMVAENTRLKRQLAEANSNAAYYKEAYDYLTRQLQVEAARERMEDVSA